MAERNKEGKPLIHCITNPIAMNQSANAILAVGGRPIMAEHPLEVEEITKTAQALLLNFGNISDIRMSAMEKSIAAANRGNIPVVVDAVGVACSKLRMDFFEKLMAGNKATVIKGNYSEILSLQNRDYKASGVDAEPNLEIENIKKAAVELADKYSAIILATGSSDVIATGDGVALVENSCPQLGSVTGTGCMLGAIIATFLAFDNSFSAVEKACRFFKECGNKAMTREGSGTFMVNLMDRLGDYDA